MRESNRSRLCIGRERPNVIVLATVRTFRRQAGRWLPVGLVPQIAGVRRVGLQHAECRSAAHKDGADRGGFLNCNAQMSRAWGTAGAKLDAAPIGAFVACPQNIARPILRRFHGNCRFSSLGPLRESVAIELHTANRS